jgi:hypothetical protein
MTSFQRVLLLTLLALVSPRANAATDEQIGQAIEKSKAFLYSQQKYGTWERSETRQGANGASVTGDQWGGLTAMATYALLAAGENAQDPRLAQAVQFLHEAELVGLYALGMRCQVWAELPKTPEVRASVRRDAQAILNAMKTEPPVAGLFDYTDNDTGRIDHSVSQYAVLGLWACADSNLDIPLNSWKNIEQAWIRGQTTSGGWTYRPREGKPTPSMTAAGIATLFITQDQLHAGDSLECKGNVFNPAIERGLKWIIEQFDTISTSEHRFYTLYGIERIGVASGYKYFGNINWYQHGADYLISQQRPDGSWGSGATISDTAFGLLFLARGRAPIVINKLQYDMQIPGGQREGNWNQRPRDVSSVVKWIGKQTERDLHWQIVHLNVPVDELHDAPILYVAGNEALNLTAAEKDKLHAFIEQGGIILASADCASPAFAESFKTMARDMFPQYEMRELPSDHVIYRNQQFHREKWKNKPSVLGLSNGVREMMLLVPTADLSRAWQMQTPGNKEELYQLAANLILYSVEKQNLQNRGQSHVIRPIENAPITRAVRLARLKYDGNWDPEPGGWKRLAIVLRNLRGIDLQVDTVDLATGDLAPYKIAHLTGTTAIKLDFETRQRLINFVKGGGTLIVDAAGGSSAFADHADAELKATFSEATTAFNAPLPPTHPVFQQANLLSDGISYRAYTRINLVGKMRDPRIRAAEIAGRSAIFFSREDLSAGLVGQPIDGILAYEPNTATDLMAKMILFAAFNGKVPPPPTTSTAPTTQPAKQRQNTKQSRSPAGGSKVAN